MLSVFPRGFGYVACLMRLVLSPDASSEAMATNDHRRIRILILRLPARRIALKFEPVPVRAACLVQCIADAEYR